MFMQVVSWWVRRHGISGVGTRPTPSLVLLPSGPCGDRGADCILLGRSLADGQPVAGGRQGQHHCQVRQGRLYLSQVQRPGLPWTGMYEGEKIHIIFSIISNWYKFYIQLPN